MKKIKGMKRRKNGLKSPRNGKAVTSYPAPYRKLKRPCRYCGSNVRTGTLPHFCSSTCLYLYSMLPGNGRAYLLEHAQLPPGPQPRFPQRITAYVRPPGLPCVYVNPEDNA